MDSKITRRSVLAGVPAVAVAAALPAIPALAVRAVDSEEEQLLAVFRQLPDDRRELIHWTMRAFAGLPDDPQFMRQWYDSDTKRLAGGAA